MTKNYSPMRCAICRRPLIKAAALKGGLPVGRTCAVSAGLVQIKPKVSAQSSLDFAPACTLTMDLFTPQTP